MAVSRTLALGVVGASLAEVGFATVTRPFTIAADVVVTVGIAALVAVLTLQRLLPMAPRPIARRQVATPSEPPSARWGFWIVSLLLVGGWELFNFAETPRQAHPTLSSLVDSVTIHPIGRGIAFIGWPAFGWYAVTR